MGAAARYRCPPLRCLAPGADRVKNQGYAARADRTTRGGSRLPGSRFRTGHRLGGQTDTDSNPDADTHDHPDEHSCSDEYTVSDADPDADRKADGDADSR
jgi:hypothetical protein